VLDEDRPDTDVGPARYCSKSFPAQKAAIEQLPIEQGTPRALIAATMRSRFQPDRRRAGSTNA